MLLARVALTQNLLSPLTSYSVPRSGRVVQLRQSRVGRQGDRSGRARVRRLPAPEIRRKGRHSCERRFETWKLASMTCEN